MSNRKNAIKPTAAMAAHREVTQWQGPLPPPESLARYDEVIPGSAQTIIDMAVKEQEHRHKSEDNEARRQYIVAIVSMLFALLCVLLLVGLVFYTVYRGSDNAYLASIISAIASVAGVFILRKFFLKK